MTRVIRSLICVAVLCQFGLSGVVYGQPPQPAQEEFVPLSEIPADEQIPAFTLLASAYALVWIVLVGYVWSVSRRLQTIEGELASLARKRS
ncbi:MAG TPA: CcmD family protein [Vicinamibacterales bacterium]|nr:CcmD family protein [Vicinamibacterales bacterium]